MELQRCSCFCSETSCFFVVIMMMSLLLIDNYFSYLEVREPCQFDMQRHRRRKGWNRAVCAEGTSVPCDLHSLHFFLFSFCFSVTACTSLLVFFSFAYCCSCVFQRKENVSFPGVRVSVCMCVCVGAGVSAGGVPRHRALINTHGLFHTAFVFCSLLSTVFFLLCPATRFRFRLCLSVLLLSSRCSSNFLLTA